MTKNTKKPSYKEIGDHFTAFELYQKILNNNYMFHHNMSLQLSSFIKNNFDSNPFDFLDIGSGDARYTSDLLNQTNIKSYTALDVSVETIESAKNNTEELNCSKDFLIADVSRKFPKLNKKFDIIWSSYMLHHFSLNEKELFFKTCLTLLKHNAFLIVIDFINNYKTRKELLINMKEYWKTKWTKLNNFDQDFLVKHVNSSDYPESVEKHFEIAKNIGFNNSRLQYKIDHYAFMVFEN